MEAEVSFGAWIGKRRKMLDLTRAELAQCAGCSVSALRKIEADERRPSRQLAELLAGCLQIPDDARPVFIQVARRQEWLERLVAALDNAQDPAIRTPDPPAPAPHLPQPPTPLVGRESELAALARLLHNPQSRLVTIIGPGGVGKTRLALALAAGQAARFDDGVFFVSLAGLAAPQFIPTAVAEALGFSFSGPAEPQAQLCRYLAAKRLLLLLDNVEHLLDGAGFLAKMMQAAPEIKLLVTSRERLNLAAEWVFDLQGLPAPPPDQVGETEAYSAVTLFVQAAYRMRPDLTLTAEDLKAVARICRLVEGMPLALELAAAWVRLLSCAEIVAEIERGLDFLSSAMRDVPARQRSLRATFDYSWNLLTAGEKQVLSRLAAFRGSFTREAAVQVAGATLSDLLALVSKSLIRHAESGRYDLHEVVCQYAFSHLTRTPEYAETCNRHSHFYLTLLHDQDAALRGSDQHQAKRRLTAEIDNLRAAWDWAVSRKLFDAISPAVRGLARLFELSGWLDEGVTLLEPVIRDGRAAMDDPVRRPMLGEALAQQAFLHFRRGTFAEAHERIDESLALLRPFDDPDLLMYPLVIGGVILFLEGDLDGSQAMLEEALACARTVGDHWCQAYADFNLGYLTHLHGDHQAGYDRMVTVLSYWRTMGDPRSTSLFLNHLSPAAIQLGRYREAEAFLQESIKLCQKVGDRWGIGTALRYLGLAALAQGDAKQARDYLYQSLAVHRGFVTGWDIARSLIYLGEATRLLGDSPGARSILLDAVAEAQATCTPALVLSALAALLALMSPDELTGSAGVIAFALAHPACTSETQGRFAALWDTLAIRMPQEELAEVQTWAAKQSFDAILQHLRTTGA